MFKESEIIELKEILTKDIKKKIVAFSNSNGGTIYIGVKNDGTTIGLENISSNLEALSSIIHDAIKPDLTMLTTISELQIDGKKIIEIRIGKGINKPYYIYEKGLKQNLLVKFFLMS